MMKQVCDYIIQNGDGLLESRGVVRAVQSFIQRMNIIIDYTPEDLYKGRAIIITPEDTSDLHAQKV
jgi:hypothetical protein